MATQPQDSGSTNTPAPLPITKDEPDITGLFAGVLQSIILNAARNIAVTSSTVSGFTVNNGGDKPPSVTMTIGEVSRTFYLITATEEPTNEVPVLTEEQLRAARHEHNMKF